MAGSDAGSGSGDGGSQTSGSSFEASGKFSPNQDENDVFEETQAFQTALFGILYTVSKEKDRVPIGLVAFRLAFDVLQLWLLMVNPQYGYNIDKDSLIWQIVNFVQLNDFMSSRGYTFFLACLYIFIVMLAFDVGLCVWVGQAFRSNRFDMVWPIVWLRYFSLVFFQVLDIASMTLFLMALDCRYFSVDDALQYVNQEFGVECWSMPHLAHAAASVIALVGFTVLAAAFQMGEMELNLLTRNYLAMGHSKVEVLGFFIKFVMTCASVFIVSLKWYSVVQFACASWMLYLYLKWEPHYYSIVNNIRVASYALVWYCATLLLFMAFLPGVDQSDDAAVDDYKKRVSNAMWGGMIPLFILGWAASHFRLRYLSVNVLQRFRKPGATMTIATYEFRDAREVELLARCCRKWTDPTTLDEEAVALAETIIRAGLLQLPKDPYMIILYSSFLIDVQTSYQSGYAQLQLAKKLDPSFIDRFAIYSREQQHTQKAAGANPGSATDLVSYVEFQRNYRLALKVHREALLAIRGFWQLLVHAEVNFDGLGKAVIHIDSTIKAAEKTYRMVLQRHSSNVKIVRMYAKFLESCKEDPWGAARWYTEADKLEQQDEESKNNNMLDGFTLGDNAQIGDAEGRGVVIANAQGLIQMCNAAVCDILGYGRTELKGRNVSMLCPSPIREAHPKLMRQFVSEGRELKMETLMNKLRHQVALHKEGHLVPMRVMITRIAGIGEDSIFMGIMESLRVPPRTAHLWVLAASGMVISADEAFMDWTGFKVEECTGVGLGALMVQNVEVTEALKAARKLMCEKAAEAQKQHQQAKRENSPRKKPNMAEMRQPSMIMIAEQFKSAALAQSRGGFIPVGARSIPAAAGAVAESAEEDMEAALQAAEAAAGLSQTAPTNAGVRALAARKMSDDSSQRRSANIVAMPGALSAAENPFIPAAASPRASMMSLSAAAPVPLMVETAPLAPAAWAKPATPLTGDNSISTKWTVKRVQLLHKYSALMEVDVTITTSGVGAYAFHTLSFSRPVPAPKPPSKTGAPPASRRASSRLASSPRAPAQCLALGEDTVLMNSGVVPHPPLGAPACVPRPPADTAPVSESHMLVCDRKGRILHVTQALAARLGTTKKALCANGSTHAMDAVLPQPFAQLHRSLISQGPLGSGQPPYSCRAKLAVPLLAKGPGGQQLLPFRIDSTKREVAGSGEVVHVINLQEVSLVQALAERRMLLRLDGFGKVIDVLSPSPKRLFGLDASSLAGRSIAEFVDVFQRGSGSETRESEEQYTEKLLSKLVSRAVEVPGRSYRVGVTSGPAAHEAILEAARKGALAAAIPANRVCPAVMTLRLAKLNGAESEEADETAGLDDSMDDGTLHSIDDMCIEVELWRSDLMTSVIELDANGTIVPCGSATATPLQPPGLVFGAPESSMPGQHIGAYLPLKGKPFKSLFELSVDQNGAITRGAAAENIHKASSLKRKVSPDGEEWTGSAGPVHTFRMQHVTEEADVDVSIQIVRKAGSAGTSFFLVAHMLHPRTSHPGLAEWLLHGRMPAPPRDIGRIRRDITGKWRRSSVLADGSSPALLAAGDAVLSPEALPPPRSASASAAPSRSYSVNTAGVQAAGAALNDGDVAEHDDAASGHAASGSEGEAQDPVQAARPGSASGSERSERAAASIAGVARWLADSAENNLDAPKKANGSSAKAAHASPGTPPQGKAKTMDEDDEDPKAAGNRKARQNSFEDEDHEHGSEDEHGNGHAEGMQRSTHHGDDSSGDKTGSDVGDDASAPGVQQDGYRRGHRFKKLYRMIGSPQAQRTVKLFKLQMYAMVAFVLAVHCGCFAVMLLYMKEQNFRVGILNKAGLAARYAGEIAVYTDSLRIIYENNTLPWLSGMSSRADLAKMLALYDDRITKFTAAHLEVYMDLGGADITNDYGLRAMWNLPTINASMFYDILLNQTVNPYAIPKQPTKSYEMKSLFDVGTMLGTQARDLHDYINTYVTQFNRSLINTRQYQFIRENSMTPVAGTYLTFLDIMVMVVVQDAENVNKAQINILALEGAVLTCVVIMYTWILATWVNRQRRLVYGVFVSLPMALVRSLATKRLNLDDEDEDEDDVADPSVKQALDGAPGVLTEKQLKEVSGGAAGKRGGGGKAITFGGNLPNGATAEKRVEEPGTSSIKDAGDTQGTFVARLFSRLRGSLDAVKRKLSRNTSSIKLGRRRQRQLKGSLFSNISLAWPLLVWGALVIAMNGIGYNMLADISSPIATFNIVNFVMVRMERNLYNIISIAYTDSMTQVNSYRAALIKGVFEKEFAVALYGASIMPNETSPHYTLAKTGITQTGGQGTYLLFDTRDCLCMDPADCHTDPNDIYYTISHSGLHRLAVEYIRLRTTITKMTGFDPRLGGPDFAWIWNLHHDLTGGFERLNNAYHQHVENVYQQVADLHIALFVLTIIILAGFVFFVLRPFLANTTNEGRRVAELLSQLPSEVDMEGLLARALIQGTGARAANAVSSKSGASEGASGTMRSGSAKKGMGFSKDA